MSIWTKIALSAAVIFGAASAAAFAGDHDLVTELRDSGRVLGQTTPAGAYASAFTRRVIRNGPVAIPILRGTADRQSAWYRI